MLRCGVALVLVAATALSPVAQAAVSPDDVCTDLPCPASYADMRAVLATASEREWITVTAAGRSAGGLEIPLVRLTGGDDADYRLLLVGQQHGDEPAGKDALLHLIAAASRDRALVPDGVELWIVPMANPDGAAVDRRRNSSDADLNRDHLLLDQPETRALHRLVREARPHVVVDCHEFDRTTGDYLDRGWSKWPLITMDTANHPLLPESVLRNGLAWVEAVAQEVDRAGFAYRRYLVGGPPPDRELRPSTFDGDDARNGLALAAGSLGFIIESGLERAADDPQADIAERVAAYMTLLELFLTDADLRRAALSTAAEARLLGPPEFIATNVFWGRTDPEHPVVEIVSTTTGNGIDVPAPNLMTDRVFKRWQATPVGYVIDGAVAEAYRELLERHAIGYEVLTENDTATVESCRVERIEDGTDAVYERYPGRQIVSCGKASDRTFAPGAVVVDLDPATWRTAVALLEPTMLYGLYQYERFRATVAEDGTIPVWRVVEP